ncbi:MAG: 4a-hydroxytetrahydrobiopterin dehydratase [Ignavibacteria bacterium]|jgi:4a-hydroxytetrahydrobiopterin dehydratase
MSEKLSKDVIEENLKKLPGWRFQDNCIKKVFNTQNYPSTMGFVTAVGAISQKHNHHPDYILMKYKEVEVSFSTHSAGGITQKDIDVAADIEGIPL